MCDLVRRIRDPSQRVKLLRGAARSCGGATAGRQKSKRIVPPSPPDPPEGEPLGRPSLAGARPTRGLRLSVVEAAWLAAQRGGLGSRFVTEEVAPKCATPGDRRRVHEPPADWPDSQGACVCGGPCMGTMRWIRESTAREHGYRHRFVGVCDASAIWGTLDWLRNPLQRGPVPNRCGGLTPPQSIRAVTSCCSAGRAKSGYL